MYRIGEGGLKHLTSKNPPQSSNTMQAKQGLKVCIPRKKGLKV